MTRVLIADDHAILRRGLKDILVQVLDSVQFGEAENGSQVLAQVEKESWDIVLLDITMPGPSGIEVLHEALKIRPDLPVLVLSMHPEQEYGKRALRAGARGYVRKDRSPDELVSAVQQILKGEKYVSAQFAGRLAQDRDGVYGCRSPHQSLSDRELGVLCRLGAGKTVSQIAEELGLSVATISTYRSRILEKMQMTTTAQLVLYALRNGLAE